MTILYLFNPSEIHYRRAGFAIIKVLVFCVKNAICRKISAFWAFLNRKKTVTIKQLHINPIFTYSKYTISILYLILPYKVVIIKANRISKMLIGKFCQPWRVLSKNQNFSTLKVENTRYFRKRWCQCLL